MGGGKKGTDASRAERKAKKRKLEDAIPDVPGDNEIPEKLEIVKKSEEPPKKRKREHDDNDAGESGLTQEKQKKKDKKDKKDKKRNSKSNGQGELTPDAIGAEEVVSKSEAEAEKTLESSEIPRKSKKERKAERKAREAAEAAANKDAEVPAETSAAGGSTEAPVAATTKEKKVKKDKKKQDKKGNSAAETQNTTNGNDEQSGGKAARFIVFIGKHIHELLTYNYYRTDSVLRQPTVYRHDGIHPEALRVGETHLSAQPDAERRPYEVQGVRLLRIRRLRPHEDMSEALPPFHV
jgi:nucleolar protein 6